MVLLVQLGFPLGAVLAELVPSLPCDRNAGRHDAEACRQPPLFWVHARDARCRNHLVKVRKRVSQAGLGSGTPHISSLFRGLIGCVSWPPVPPSSTSPDTFDAELGSNQNHTRPQPIGRGRGSGHAGNKAHRTLTVRCGPWLHPHAVDVAGQRSAKPRTPRSVIRCG
jgi:hypothetical protein